MGKLLCDHIGKPALLEHLAEECSELSFACLKYARFLRGENKVYGTTDETLYMNLCEEIADVRTITNEIFWANVVPIGRVLDIEQSKYHRMMERMEEEDKENER